MATNTAQVLPPSRNDPRQVVNTLKKTVNWNDLGIGSGVAFDNSLPEGAFITGVWVEIVTPFNAVTTNVLTVGTNAATYNNLVAAADINEAVAGVTWVSRGLGQSIALAAAITPYAMYTQTGGAATAGQAVILITYEGGRLS